MGPKVICPLCKNSVSKKGLGSHKGKGPCKTGARVTELKESGFVLLRWQSMSLDTVRYFKLESFYDAYYYDQYKGERKDVWVQAWVGKIVETLINWARTKHVTTMLKKASQEVDASPIWTTRSPDRIRRRVMTRMLHAFFKDFSRLSEDDQMARRVSIELMDEKWVFRAFFGGHTAPVLEEAVQADQRAFLRWKRDQEDALERRAAWERTLPFRLARERNAKKMGRRGPRKVRRGVAQANEDLPQVS